MDHMYQVFLERFGKQRPRRMGRLDVVALIEYKDAPLHIAQQAVKDFVEAVSYTHLTLPTKA